MKKTQHNIAHERISQSASRSPYLVWLIWVVWLPLIIPTILQFVQSHPSMPRLIVMLIGMVLFFVLYLWAAWLRAQRLVATSPLSKGRETLTWLAIIALTLLSLALVLLGGTKWLALFYFTSGYVGGSLPIRRTILAAATLTLLVVVFGWQAGLSGFDLMQSLVFIPAIIFITKSVIWSITTSWELHAAREEIAHLAVMTERLRIARDLHDLLGHNLSLIALKSELAGRLISIAPERAVVEIGDVEHVARTTLQEVREAVGNYRQPTLSSELHGAKEILAAASIAYHYEGDEGIPGHLPNSIEAVLAWTVREGVTNVIRHSRAHHCTISVKREKQTTCIEVLDDGINASLIPAPQVREVAGMSATDSASNDGNGLRGLAERVTALGGHCEIGRRMGTTGFRLAVRMPVIQNAAMPDMLS